MASFVECFPADVEFLDAPIDLDAVFSPCEFDIDMAMGVLSGNYNDLENKPSIETHVLVGDSTLEEIGVRNITPQSIDRLIYG